MDYSFEKLSRNIFSLFLIRVYAKTLSGNPNQRTLLILARFWHCVKKHFIVIRPQRPFASNDAFSPLPWSDVSGQIYCVTARVAEPDVKCPTAAPTFPKFPMPTPQRNRNEIWLSTIL